MPKPTFQTLAFASIELESAGSPFTAWLQSKEQI